MAKKKQGKNRRNFVAIPFNTDIVLATLADNTVLPATLFSSAFGEDIYVISIDASWILAGSSSQEGPIFVGFAHGDLSAAEILEALDAEQTDPDDRIAKERSSRPIRRVGGFDAQIANETLNHGVNIRTPMKMSIGNDHFVDAWAVNRSGATLTTGAIIHVNGTLFGRWQR